MEQNNISIFEFGIDEISRLHLTSIAKWNKFLAIVNIVLLSFGILAIVLGGTSAMMVLFIGKGANDIANSSILSFVIVLYAIVIGVFMIPNISRLKFSNKMLKALVTDDQILLNESLGHLKAFSKFWGIATIIIIAFYLIFFLIAIMGLALG